MAHTCSQCGRPYADHDLMPGEFALDDGTPDALTADTPASEGGNSRLLAWIAGGVAIWLLLSLVIGLFRSADPTDVAVEAPPTPEPTAVPTPTPDVTEVAAPLAAPRATSIPSAEAHDAPQPEESTSTEPTRQAPASGLRMLQRQLDRQSVAASIAYATDEGVAIISMDTLDVHRVAALTGPVDVDPGALVLQTTTGPVILDPVGPAVTRVPIDGDLIVNEETGDSHVLQISADGDPLVLTDDALEAIEPNSGSRLVPLPGFGILAIHDEQQGPTTIAGAEGFEPFSAHPVITANQAGRVEAQCPTPISCSTIIVGHDGDEWTVADDFIRLGDQVHLAPDGSAILRVTADGYAELFAEDGWTSWVIGKGMQYPVWATDASFIAWIDVDAGPALKVMFPETRDWINVPLADIGAPEPLTADLVIF